ncbi:MAG: hypothetical protein ACYC6Z_06950 [Thermoleophilia bacterium]
MDSNVHTHEPRESPTNEKRESYTSNQLVINGKRDMTTQRIIRYADLLPEQTEKLFMFTSMEDGVELDPMRIDHVDWVVVTEQTNGENSFRLYYLYKNGKIIDFFPERSLLEEAMGDVGIEIAADQWKTCDVLLKNDDDVISRDLIA